VPPFPLDAETLDFEHPESEDGILRGFRADVSDDAGITAFLAWQRPVTVNRQPSTVRRLIASGSPLLCIPIKMDGSNHETYFCSAASLFAASHARLG
jgi:hypothetical protein